MGEALTKCYKVKGCGWDGCNDDLSILIDRNTPLDTEGKEKRVLPVMMRKSSL